MYDRVLFRVSTTVRLEVQKNKMIFFEEMDLISFYVNIFNCLFLQDGRRKNPLRLKHSSAFQSSRIEIVWLHH